MTAQQPLFANKTMSAPFMQWDERLIDVATFLRDVATVANSMSSKTYAINLCEHRYHFLVGFAAALTKQHITLLPQHQKSALLSELQYQYPESCILTDDSIKAQLEEPKESELPMMPMINLEQVACVFFTSGSSAAPIAHEKQWGDLVVRARRVSVELGLDKEIYCLLATVPSQHLFGFEHMAMLAFQTNVVLHSSRPFYPSDMLQVLTKTKYLCYLISTPYHLSCFVRSDMNMPVVKNLLSSTAPLSKDLAQKVEVFFGGDLKEIYGCTELGAIAIRRTAKEDNWHLINGLKIVKKEDDYFIESIQTGKVEALPDVIEQHTETDFSLVSRKEDNIKIAGKRSSQKYLIERLNELNGVQDATLYSVNAALDRAKLIAIVVAPDISAQEIKAQLRGLVDDVFIPKQIINVKMIPRNNVGKITQVELLKLILSHSEQIASFEIQASHPALAGHFPNNPLVPGVVILDNVMACFKQIAPKFRVKQFIQVKFHEKLRAEQPCSVKFSLHRKGVQFKAFVKQRLIISGIFNL